MKLIQGVAALALLFTAACGCDADLRSRFEPESRTLKVGESFAAKVRLLGCGGTEPLSDVITWSAQDTSIVQVDAVSGLTRALRPGTTLVSATGQRYHNVGGIMVTVVAP